MTVELTITVGNTQYVVTGQDDTEDNETSWVRAMKDDADAIYSARMADGSWVVIPLAKIDGIEGRPEVDD